MQHLQSLGLLEERIQAAVEMIKHLKSERRRLEAETARLHEAQRALERRIESLTQEKLELSAEGQELRAKLQQSNQLEADREEIRARIDGMIAKFEELEI
jgi:multidrug resistance efflux pump